MALFFVWMYRRCRWFEFQSYSVSYRKEKKKWKKTSTTSIMALKAALRFGNKLNIYITLLVIHVQVNIYTLFVWFNWELMYTPRYDVISSRKFLIIERDSKQAFYWSLVFSLAQHFNICHVWVIYMQIAMQTVHSVYTVAVLGICLQLFFRSLNVSISLPLSRSFFFPPSISVQKFTFIAIFFFLFILMPKAKSKNEKYIFTLLRISR